MSNILFIASDYKPWPGGIAEYLDSLARGLISLGDTISVLAVVGPEETERTRFLRNYEAWVSPFPMQADRKPSNRLGQKFVSALEILRCTNPNWRGLLGKFPIFKSSTTSIQNLESVLLVNKPDVVIFGHLDVKLYPLSLCLEDRKIPYVIIAHDSEICQVPGNGKNDLVLRGRMLRRANWIAANSHHTKSLLDDWKVPADRVKIIYPPISQDAVRESVTLEPTVSDKDHFTLVTICRLVRGKGVDLVLRALKILDARHIPYRYLIGGDGPERQSLESMVDKFGLRDKVHFKGPVAGQDKWHLLRMGDVFVTPSRFDPSIPWKEGFGIAFIEAAAFGIPAVASTSGGIPDAVIDGKSGILVPEESPEGIANALTLLYQKPEIRREMSRVARERARTQFSPEAIANHFRKELAHTTCHRV